MSKPRHRNSKAKKPVVGVRKVFRLNHQGELVKLANERHWRLFETVVGIDPDDSRRPVWAQTAEYTSAEAHELMNTIRAEREARRAQKRAA